MIVAVAVLGCDGERIDREGATVLWEEIGAANYQGWQTAPGYDAPRPTLRAHGDTALVYINDVMLAAQAQVDLPEWPVGSLLVKDSFDANGTPHLIAAMHKQEQGWFFAEWSAAGEVKYAGEPEVCLGCHRAAPDYVFTVSLSR
jgi:hypothetical protein